MKYFAYGSNMSSKRLRARTESARAVGVYTLHGFALRFHKVGKDGSGKCDAFRTGDSADRVVGVLYDLDPADEAPLDRIEGPGWGYRKEEVEVEGPGGDVESAFTYCAIRIDPSLRPYSWYLEHVLAGAREAGLPEGYVAEIERYDATPDPCEARERAELAIYA